MEETDPLSPPFKTSEQGQKPDGTGLCGERQREKARVRGRDFLDVRYSKMLESEGEEREKRRH